MWLIVIGVLIITGATLLLGMPGSDTVNSLALEISVEDAHQLRENGAFILDVRESHEWEAGHIPEATLIPLGELANRVNELPKDRVTGYEFGDSSDKNRTKEFLKKLLIHNIEVYKNGNSYAVA